MKFVFFILLFYLFSCNLNHKCEAFNINRLPYGTLFLRDSLVFSNSKDTIIFSLISSSMSNESDINSFTGECENTFEFEYQDKLNNFILIGNINYNQNIESINNTYLDMILLNSQFSSRLDTLNYKNFEITKIDQLNNSDKSKMISKIKMVGLLIYEFHTYKGDIWRLIK